MTRACQARFGARCLDPADFANDLRETGDKDLIALADEVVAVAKENSWIEEAQDADE